jgi:hypothetical protein
MEEIEYFKKSKREKLPLRCPLIGKCERYAQTIFYLTQLYRFGNGNDYEESLRKEELISENYITEKVKTIGEPFRFHKTENTCSFSNGCPEVPLFNNEEIFSFIPQKPISSGFWDNFWNLDQFGKDKKFQIQKVKHYSECPEFSQHSYDKKTVTSPKSKNRRVPISKKLRFEIFQRDSFTCQYCKRSKNEDNVKLQLDHKIPVSEGGTDHINNLITSCEDCNLGKSNKII